MNEASLTILGTRVTDVGSLKYYTLLLHCTSDTSNFLNSASSIIVV
jgi:hypothetical protein